MSPALQDFFGGVQSVAANPAEVAARQSMLSNAEILVRRFQTMDERLNEIQGGVNTQIEDSASLINTWRNASLN